MKRKLYSTAAVFLAVTGAFMFINAERYGSNAKTSKFAVLQPHSHDRAPADYNKAKSPISTSVVRVDDGSLAGYLELKGTVKASFAISNLKIVWALPSDVEVVSGANETLVNLASGESQSFEIVIKKKTLENRQVHFTVQTTDQPEGNNFGSSAQYNTTQQEVIAKQLKKNFLEAREKVRSGELRKIVF